MRGIATLLAIASLVSAFAAGASGQTLFETDLAGAEPYIFPLPLPAGFRLSGGVAVNGNKVTFNALANGTGTVTINRVTLSQGGTSVDGRVGFKDLAPYSGLGYTKVFGGGFKLSCDAGVLFGAAPMLSEAGLPGLPDNLAVQNDYLESHSKTAAVAPLAEVTFSLRF